MKNNELVQYADENQLELYKNFPSTHYLSNQNNVLHVLAWATFFKRNFTSIYNGYNYYFRIFKNAGHYLI